MTVEPSSSKSAFKNETEALNFLKKSTTKERKYKNVLNEISGGKKLQVRDFGKKFRFQVGSVIVDVPKNPKKLKSSGTMDNLRKKLRLGNKATTENELIKAARDLMNANQMEAPIQFPIQIPVNTVEEAKKNLKKVDPIHPKYTRVTSIEDQRKAHQKAKAFLKENLKNIGADIEFITPPPLNPVSVPGGPPNPQIFSWETTSGVRNDIEQDGKRKEDNIILYAVASQFNGCESPGRFTVKPGFAVKTYQNDHTQGPDAQLAFNPLQVELINCGGNLGFNGLVDVLDETTKEATEHGYLTPVSKNVDQVIKQLKSNSHKIEYSCIANKPILGKKPVHQILTSAAAFGGYNKDTKLDEAKKKEVEFLCALQGFRAQFQHALKLAEGGKPVILKTAAVGLSAFGNDTDTITEAFHSAAKEFEDRLARQNVQVRLQVFGGIGKARDMADSLGLKQNQPSHSAGSIF